MMALTMLKSLAMFIFCIYFVASFGQRRDLNFGKFFVNNGALYVGLGSLILILSIIFQFFQLVACVYIKMFKDQADGSLQKSVPAPEMTSRSGKDLDKSMIVEGTGDHSRLALAPNLNVINNNNILAALK